jgi:hypothetical protein
MKSIEQPDTIKVYELVKQTGSVLSLVGGTTVTQTLGIGFYMTQQEAEHNRTIEILKNTLPKTYFHIFELEIPNIAKKSED